VNTFQVVLKTIPILIKGFFNSQLELRGSPHSLKNVIKEEQLKEEFKLKKGWTFIDVGACWGLYTVNASKQVGKNGLVIAIEPHPESYCFLVFIKSLLRLRNVTTVNAALSNRNTNLKFYFGNKNALSSLKEEYDAGLGFTQVKAITFDTLMDNYSLEKVDAIKIDVEGAELDVLEGMTKALKSCKYITFEIHGQPSIREKRAQKIINTLNYEGFQVSRFGVNDKHIMGVKM
jgi:FkbM family methyltransferase